ncbi:MAG: septum formation initiator family protein [Oscillospiraceae bacterium]|jgi:cell division protein FtsB|nr:septum formation initiator family protein [Oscillospiraceae bacterium]
MITLTTGAGAQKKQITEKQNATAEIQKENARYEDELRQLKEGLDIRPIIERIAHELGLVYPGERVFKSAGQ